MNINELKINQIIKIKGQEYEIIGIMKGFECLPPKYELRDTLYFHLLEKGSKRITPTHCMIYYFDTKEISSPKGKLKEKNIQIIS